MNDSLLFYNSHILSSESGVQQGDPLGPFLFCLAIQPIISLLQCPLNLWYMDDGTIAGDFDTVMTDFFSIQNECNEIGLKLNVSKCEIYNPKQSDHGCKEISSENFELLGAPITPSAIDNCLQLRLDNFAKIIAKLRNLPSHHSFSVLRSSVGVCRLMSTLRSSPCINSPIIDAFDSKLKEALQSILNVQLSDCSFRQATLPVKMGGMGLSDAKYHTASAFLASFYTVKHLYDENVNMSVVQLAVLKPIERAEKCPTTEVVDATNINKCFCRPDG